MVTLGGPSHRTWRPVLWLNAGVMTGAGMLVAETEAEGPLVGMYVGLETIISNACFSEG